ncbi:MAG TPA: acetolactate synthase [Defluviitaleaceae bacterium]|nr:acetolactate synthase [Candidatus Epulonipiscium sp.]HOQ17371.1 acetolactate synthase [Defluviitaleaceae bacterium]HPT75694.1 acetolactate synthase [Defluviitaleaceae bacterium]HQD51218.1 acetolactate synthase [Defluviitaleaceae bacterium]
MLIKQLSVFLENKSGRLTEVTKTLGDLDINISALSIADTAEYGILRMILTDPDKAYKALKEKGFSVRLTDVLCIATPHRPGELAKALDILSKNGISVEYMYAFEVGEKAFIVIKTADNQKTIDTIIAHKDEVELINADEICQIRAK